MTDYTASIEATIEKAAEAGREICNEVKNAVENGSTDWHNKPDERVEELEEAQALEYAYGYLESIDRADLFVEIK